MLECKSLKHRFDFGSIEFCFNLHEDIAEKIWVFSDCLNADFIAWLNEHLNKSPIKFSSTAFDAVLNELNYDGAEEMLKYIREWLIAELKAQEAKNAS